jgi:signal transduction histidine kinase
VHPLVGLQDGGDVTVRLTEFITRDMQSILASWEAFAATRLPAARHMHTLELRDHAQQILEAIVADLLTSQTPEQQSAKSMGLAPGVFQAPETAAQTHAVLRAKSGFDIEQLASEYRALRASVLKLWMEACLPAAPRIDDLIRFNEAVDQALAESIMFFSAQVEQSRNLLLGMLSHDLRSPLQTIQMTAQYLRALDARPDVSQAASRLINSGARMKALLNDLLDFNRTRLGLGIRVTPAAVDLTALCAEAIDEIRAGHPGQCVKLHLAGDCRGTWDGGRIQQLLGNLVTNAINYGTPGTTVDVALSGRENEVQLTVTNSGRIDQHALASIFEPLKRGTDNAHKNDSGLGLGLYIASEVAKAHGGSVEVVSRETITAFTVRLPRRNAAAAAAAPDAPATA